jgi:putative flippase GtrA
MPLAAFISRLIGFFHVGPLKFIPLQTFRYAACGGLNMGLNLVLYHMAYHYVLGERNLSIGIIPGIGPTGGDFPLVISPHIATGFIVVPIITLTGFWLNKYVAFKRSPLRHGTQLARYLLSVAGSIALYYISMKLLVEHAHIWPTPSYAITICVTTVYSYLMQKYFTFRGCADGD